MIQSLIILLLFAMSFFYVARLIYKSFTAKSGCASGCGKCGVDFSKISHQLEKKG
jgi:hypothetical protein